LQIGVLQKKPASTFSSGFSMNNQPAVIPKPRQASVFGQFEVERKID